VRTYVAVDGGMSDNPRPVLYGSGYESFLPRELDGERALTVRLVGKHCESGDVLAFAAQVPSDIAVGDLLAMPVTGAYGHSMGSNYNKITRPPVVFAADAMPGSWCGARPTTTCSPPTWAEVTATIRAAAMSEGDRMPVRSLIAAEDRLGQGVEVITSWMGSASRSASALPVAPSASITSTRRSGRRDRAMASNRRPRGRSGGRSSRLIHHPIP